MLVKKKETENKLGTKTELENNNPNISIEHILDKEDVTEHQLLRDIADQTSQRHKTSASGIPAFREALDYIRIKRTEVVAMHNTKIIKLNENKASLEKQIDLLRNEESEIDEQKKHKIEELASEIRNKYKNKIIEAENEIKEKKENVEQIEQEIDKLRQDPNKTYNWSFGLIVETILAFFLLAYLWIFYSTATYSAFFKNTENLSENIISTFLDPTAISSAWHQGIPMGLFITLFPFIFVALGYITFKIDNGYDYNGKQKEEIESNNVIVKIGNSFSVIKRSKTLQRLVILVLALVYDMLIAYIIAEGVYKQNIALGKDDSFNLSICLTDTHFWLIICAGFIVYLIFGWICNSASKEWANFDSQQREIKAKERARNIKNGQINYIENTEIPKLEAKREEEEAKIPNLRQIKNYDDDYQRKENSIVEKINMVENIDREINDIMKTNIPPKEINIYHAYVDGWLKSINNEDYKADVYRNYESFRKEHNMN